MKPSALFRTIVVVIPILLLISGCGRTVDPGKRGLRWSPLTGGLEKEPLRDGFYFRAPWNDVYEYDVRYQSFTEKIDALTADDLSVTVHAAITMRPIAEDIFYIAQLVRPQFLSAVRGVVAQYSMISLPERSSEIGNKIEAVMVESLKGRHLDVYSVALSEIEFSKVVLKSIEQKQSKEQEKEQKEFELVIAQRDAEIARIRAKGEGDALQIRAEGESESLRIRAKGQSQAQEIITKTLTQDYLKYKLYENPNTKTIIVPERSTVPIIVNPGPDHPR
jgi:regulator of protease activity HflC (stomatin/prohibitin superfamily)